MAECLVIADDLTGANATGVLLKKLGFETDTIISTDGLEQSTIDNSDCIIFPTDSRAVSEDIAYTRVSNVCRLFKNDKIKLYTKRIDSTLRGNISVEIEAMLDSLGEDYIAICAPCFPESGRVVCGGYMLVHGVPLIKTAAAIDPKTPVKSSNVEEILSKNCKLKCVSVYLNELNDAKSLAEKINNYKNNKVKLIIFDCISQDDLELIADAVILSNIKAITVDPGVFTATMVKRLLKSHTSVMPENKILAVVGSVNPVTKKQVENYVKTHNPFYIEVNTEHLLRDETTRTNEVNRVVNCVLNNCGEYDASIVVGDGLDPNKKLNLNIYKQKHNMDIDDISKIINNSFADIAFEICKKEHRIKGLFTSGGDITVSVYKLLKACSIKLEDEVLPLAAYGVLVNGDFNGLRVVTKGGMVGNEDAISLCMDYLRNHV